MVQTKTKREAAWRVFANEFNSATVELPSQDQYAPSYVLSPLGAMINRVYLTGVLTEIENVGTSEEPLWRGRVSDPTDVFYISAGQFQPRAAQMLAELEPPILVGIVGKARTYSPDEGTTYVSVRVELVKEITQELRDYWVYEACQNLNTRINCMKEALNMDPPEIQELISLGYNKTISTGIVEAINQFGSVDIDQYNSLLITTLKELGVDINTDKLLIKDEAAIEPEFDAEIGEESKASELFETFDGDADVDKSSDEVTTISKSDKNDFQPDSDTEPDETIEKVDNNEEKDENEDNEISEQLVFEIITSLIEDNPDGVSYDDVQSHALENGLESAIVEECIGSLIDKGLIYEPSIGIFNTV
jgi:RPA family protein